MSDNIAYTLSRTSQKLGSRVAVTEAHSGRSCSFSELDLYADRYGAYLKTEGVSSGDRVMLMVRPSIDFIALAFALFRIGAPVILIDPGMGYKNMLRCITGVQPDYLIGIPAVVGLSLLYANRFRSLKKRFCCGDFLGISKFDLRKKRNLPQPPIETFSPDETSLAAIIFTTGSTGPPKGVRFEHSIFSAQLEKIRSFYGIGQGDVDQPGFPLFALFSTALGAHAVIPDMDPTKPAQVDPQRFVDSIQKYQVTYSFTTGVANEERFTRQITGPEVYVAELLEYRFFDPNTPNFDADPISIEETLHKSEKSAHGRCAGKRGARGASF